MPRIEFSQNIFIQTSQGLLALLLCFTANGCISWKGEEGTIHHVILGFGIVRCNESTDKQVLATDTTAFGVSLSDRPGLKLGIGYASSTVVSVSSNARDVLVEVSKRPGHPIVVDTHHARPQMKEDIHP